MRVYSTQEVAKGQRLDYWSALASEAITPMRVDARKGYTSFEGRLWVDQIGSIGVSRAYSTAVVISRTGVNIAQTQERAFVVSMAEDADYCMRAKGWERLVRRNDILITDATQRGTIVHAGCTALTLRVPDRVFRQYLPGVDDLIGLVLPGDRGAGRLAATMLRAIAPKSGRHFDACSGDHLATALLHAIAGACTECFGAKSVRRATAASRRYEILQFVEAHLGDADLNVQNVAANFELSDRYVRMLFEDHGEPLSMYMQRRRLEESARQLRDPLWRSRTVSEIAFRWGFNSLGSYDRAFKARFEMTPRQYRERA
jgi:AraC family transcriptional regulator, positive regulator of tynA and feaB